MSDPPQLARQGSGSFIFWMDSTVHEFMQPGDSQIFSVTLAEPDGPSSADTKHTSRALLRAANISCRLSAPAFEVVTVGDGNCTWAIVPRDGREGTQVLVYTILSAATPIGSDYRTVRVGKTPFSLEYAATAIGVMAGIAALVFQIFDRKKTRDEP